MEAEMRCFVAVNLPGEIREEVGKFTASLSHVADGKGVRWVRPENIHLTLKFLGNVDREMLPELSLALGGALAGQPPCSLTVKGAGVFPPRGRPRIVWVGLAGETAALAALQSAVESALEPLGFPREKRPFTPHVTVGRLRDTRRPTPLGPAVAAANREREWGKCVVDRVHLMRSELFPTGPRYSILHKVRLAVEKKD
jgi:2'-5' RNA ligase